MTHRYWSKGSTSRLRQSENVRTWHSQAYRALQYLLLGKWRQLYFVYRLRSSEGAGTLASKNCPKGRGALLVFRCDPAGAASSMASAADKAATLTLPAACPDGTCDGCLYTLLLTSPHACPRCSRSDYKRIVGECRDGQQAIHYIPNTK